MQTNNGLGKFSSRMVGKTTEFSKIIARDIINNLVSRLHVDLPPEAYAMITDTISVNLTIKHSLDQENVL